VSAPAEVPPPDVVVEPNPDGLARTVAAALVARLAAAQVVHGTASVVLTGGGLPRFDVLLLGIGPEGHTASIFPESPAVSDDRPVFAVRDCPKPPPTRISLGFSAINTAEEVWLVVTGESKAPAVAAALSGADPVQLPAAGVHGRRATRWLLDQAAAGDLP
jgi:6-phosphogluconolactonase